MCYSMIVIQTMDCCIFRYFESTWTISHVPAAEAAKSRNNFGWLWHKLRVFNWVRDSPILLEIVIYRP